MTAGEDGDEDEKAEAEKALGCLPDADPAEKVKWEAPLLWASPVMRELEDPGGSRRGKEGE